MQKYNVKITELALADIEEIANFYADLVDVTAAEKFEDDAFETVKSLQTFPERTIYWDEELKLHRVNLKNHKVSVIYTVDNDVFEVVAIATFHALQQPNKHFESIKKRFS